MGDKIVSYSEDVERDVAGEENEESSEENLSLYNEQDSRQPPVPTDSIVPEQSIASNNEADNDQENINSSNTTLVEKNPGKNSDNSITEHKLDVGNNYYGNLPDNNNAVIKNKSKFKRNKSSENQFQLFFIIENLVQLFFKDFSMKPLLAKTKKDKQVKFGVDDLYSIGLFNWSKIYNFNDCLVYAVRELIDQDSASIINFILASRDREIFLCNEYFRLATFSANNCNIQEISVIRLASAGYYLDRDGAIRCFHCLYNMDQHGIDCVTRKTNHHNVPMHHPYLQLNGQNLEHNNATIDTGPGHQPLPIPDLLSIPIQGQQPLPVPDLPGISVHLQRHLPVSNVLGIAAHGQQGGLVPTDNQALQPELSESQIALLSDRRKNIYLKKRILCVKCAKEVRNILFLPCQHFLYCQYCSSYITQCPICCAVIKQPFKVYW